MNAREALTKAAENIRKMLAERGQWLAASYVESFAGLNGLQPSAEFLALRDSLSEEKVPEGWKLVPMEPTQDMTREGYRALQEPSLTISLSDLYRSMLATAPRRGCTCHPDDNPPVPCPKKYALSECRKAAAPKPD